VEVEHCAIITQNGKSKKPTRLLQERVVMRKEIKIWLIYTVIFALLPFIFEAILMILDASQDFTISNLFDGGELLIVAVAIGGDAIGRAESSKKDDYSLLSGACLISVIISAFLFGIYSNDTQENLYPVPSISLLMFIITLLLSIGIYRKK
jgi:hypothetical protein